MTELTQNDVILTSEVGGKRPIAIRVLISGSNNWENEEVVTKTLTKIFNRFHAHPHSDLILVHPTSSFALPAAAHWIELGGTVEPHEADWDGWGANAPYVRNAKMVTAQADLAIIFTSSLEDHELRALARLTEQAGIPTMMVDGFIV